MLSVLSDDYYMQQALLEAKEASRLGEIPVGAVVVCQQQIIAKAHNLTERLQDVTAHAEILAITAAAEFLGSKYLPECSLYVTLEPCVMCAGALFWSQIGKVVFGASDDKRGFMKIGKEVLHPKTTVAYGVKEEECRELMQQFFQSRR